MTLTSSRFWRGAWYGVIGTVAMLAVMVALDFVGVLPAPIYVDTIGRIFAIGIGGRSDVPAGVLVLAVPFVLAYGGLWGGLAAITSLRLTWWKGLVLAGGLWLVMMIFLVPYVAEQSFAAVHSPGIWIGTLLMHAAYGLTFGALAERHEPLEAHATSLA
jgi:hypothetical protein